MHKDAITTTVNVTMWQIRNANGRTAFWAMIALAHEPALGATRRKETRGP
jgi:hypothetical protein